MNICFVIPTLTSGGAERVVSTLANYWHQKGWTITIIVLDKTQFKPFYRLSEGINFESIEIFDKPRSYIKKVKVTRKQLALLRKKFKSIKPQVIISFIDITSLLAISASFFLPVKLVVSERSNPKKSVANPILKKLNHLFFFRFADSIVLQTERVKRDYAAHLKKKVTVIPNPVVNPPAIYKRDLAQHTYKRIVSIGRLEPVKGYDTLLCAFAKVKKKYSDWTLTILGEGSQEAALKTLAASLYIQQEVEWLGSANNVYQLLSQSDIFVLSSRFEGFPNALCEAMACGLAVVATDCNYGPRELIREGNNGFLVPVDDEDTLAIRIIQLIEDAELRKKLGSQAQHIVHSYAIENIAVQWETLLKEVVSA